MRGRWIRLGLVVAGVAAVALFGIVVSSAAAVHASGRVYWRSLRDGDQRWPRAHGMLSDWQWTHLRWSSWSRQTARGHGLAVHRSGYQVDERDRIEIVLSRTALCPDGARIYTRISATWHYPTGTRHYRWSYHCRPRLTTSGLGAGGG
jgi:hypothetical protein